MTTGPGRPEPGDYSICIECEGVSRINLDWTHVAVAEDEVARIPEVLQMVQTVRSGLREIRNSKERDKR